MGKWAPIMRLLAVVVLCELMPGVAACGRESADPPGPGRVTILYTGGVQGALEPCGCSPGQLGGIARIATLLQEIRKETDAIILVDAGDRLFQEAQISEAMGAQRILKARFMQKAYGALGAGVLNIGGNDLAGGSELAIQEAKEIGAAPLSANLFAPKGLRKTLAQAATIVDAGGVRVTFVGVMDPASVSASENELFRVEDPVARVRATVEAFRGQTDVMVLLSTLDREANARLARSVEGIDLVIGAGVRGRPENVVVPDQAGKSFLVQVKPLGEFLGRIDLSPAPAGAEGFINVTASATVHGLQPGAPVATEGIRFRDDLDLRGVPERRSRRLLPALPPVEPGTLRHTVYAIGDYLVENPGIQRLMNEYKLEVAELNRSVPISVERLPTEGARYVGDETCRGCHTSVFDFVSTLPHAHAYATLEDRQSEYDLECVGCHVTGWNKPGGFDHPAAAGNLKNVQCEACHGPGSEHVEAGGARGVGGMKAEVSLSVCLQCHTPEQSTRFAGDEESYLERIRCSRAVLADAAAMQKQKARPAGASLRE